MKSHNKIGRKNKQSIDIFDDDSIDFAGALAKIEKQARLEEQEENSKDKIIKTKGEQL